MMNPPAPPCSDVRPSSSPQGSGKRANSRHDRSQTLPIIPLTSALTTISPKQAVPLGKASVTSIPIKKRVEAINYGSPAGPGLISRVKPVPPRSAPPSSVMTRRKRLEIEPTVKDEEKEVVMREEMGDVDEEQEDVDDLILS